MKGKCTSSSSHTITTQAIIKTVAFLSLLCFSLFFLSKHFSSYTQHQHEHLYFFNSTSTNTSLPPAPSPSRPQRPLVESTGIINELGIMTSNFMIGEFDEGLLVENAKVGDISEKVKGENDEGEVSKLRVCDMNMSDYVPFLENVGAVSKGFDCLVPRPKGYKLPMPWPRSMDEVWFENIHYKAKDNEGVSKKDDKLVFSSEVGSKSDQNLEQMVPEIAFGQRTRVVLDVIGSGIADFGAYLMGRNVTTLSVAGKDQAKRVQLALERGVPAMMAAFGTSRFPFPSQAFDLIRCSRCGINWTLNDGILLIEANRFLRGGGYFVWEADAVYKYEGELGEQWREMEDLSRNLCWELVSKEGYIAVWQKPLNNSCYLVRDPDIRPPLCDQDDNPDDLWRVKAKKCIARIPEDGNGANLTDWPARLHSVPDRLLSIKTDSDVSRRQLYRADSIYCNAIVHGYVSVFKINEAKIRNVMDMRAGYGGFAAALLESRANSWVMNVVPSSGPNTLPVIYDRGLIGVMHDWCEPFDTYPRTYDLLNAAGLFSVEQKRCNVRNIMLEMDRILRPDGRAYIRDTTAVIYELREIAETMGWIAHMFDTEEGPYSDWKLLICTKQM
ncbi:probable methyltransferase PMT10 [Salvia hispanica]|uniref:probable methyltransferase PMT10 n=1 Tax=Salvia hispanica TaxID=49212 RepID=UPI002009174E|nr:probable methyltransferase PMT10 [Salvia hispanica]